MKIESVDAFYLAMPDIADVGDGSQDMLLVRLRSGGFTGWGECEAAPLVSIASLVCPMSHSACKPVLASVLGQELESTSDIFRIASEVRTNSADLLQSDHTLSGIEIAMWDLLGHREERPVFEMLGYKRAYGKKAYASVLFGQDPQETLRRAQEIGSRGFGAVKFGWGKFGRGTVEDDAEQLRAAREGAGPDATLLVDAGTVWGEDVEAAALRLPVLEECDVRWLEEPFVTGATVAYRELASRGASIALAGGEGSHNFHMAENMIEHGALRYVQIDAGRIGGISEAYRVARYADARHVQYVNHTFTSHLALSASLQPYAGLRAHALSEYPAALKQIAWDATREHIVPDTSGEVRAPEAPGLGVTPQPELLRRYLVDVEISVGGRSIYRTPTLTE